MAWEKKEVSYLSTLINFAKRFDNKELTKETVVQYFKENYYFNDKSDIEVQTYKLVNNLITLSSDILKDLIEINNNIKDSKNLFVNPNDKNSYEEKKQRYFIKINEEAKEEKEKILLNEMLPKLKKRMKRNTNGIEDIGILEKLDDYSWSSKWYNPNFDFGVLIKFFDPLNQNISEVENLIENKNNDKSKYYAFVKTYIREKNVLEYILANVSNHYLLSEKKEVFNILAGLFENEKFQSFVSLGAIQVEGLFYDFCSAINGGERKNEEGTLINKLEKVFSENKIEEKIYYPYFAFEVPKYRNEVAHNGVAIDENLEFLALDIVMDMFTIIKLMKRNSLPYNNVDFLFFQFKFYSGIPIYSRDYYEEILGDLFSTYQMGIDGVGKYSVYNIIKNCETYKDILSKFKKINPEDESYYMLYDEVVKFKVIFEDEEFWKVIIELIINEDLNNDDFLDFTKKLVNEFIAYLKSNNQAKAKCVELNKMLKDY